MTPPRVNGRIRTTQVTLIDEEGADLGVFSLSEALALALSQKKDLVEVDAESTPPVCQVIDHGKYRYQLQQRRNERRHD